MSARQTQKSVNIQFRIAYFFTLFFAKNGLFCPVLDLWHNKISKLYYAFRILKFRIEFRINNMY